MGLYDDIELDETEEEARRRALREMEADSILAPSLQTIEGSGLDTAVQDALDPDRPATAAERFLSPARQTIADSGLNTAVQSALSPASSPTTAAAPEPPAPPPPATVEPTPRASLVSDIAGQAEEAIAQSGLGTAVQDALPERPAPTPPPSLQTPPPPTAGTTGLTITPPVDVGLGDPNSGLSSPRGEWSGEEIAPPSNPNLGPVPDSARQAMEAWLAQQQAMPNPQPGLVAPGTKPTTSTPPVATPDAEYDVPEWMIRMAQSTGAVPENFSGEVSQGSPMAQALRYLSGEADLSEVLPEGVGLTDLLSGNVDLGSASPQGQAPGGKPGAPGGKPGADPSKPAGPSHGQSLEDFRREMISDDRGRTQRQIQDTINRHHLISGVTGLLTSLVGLPGGHAVRPGAIGNDPTAAIRAISQEGARRQRAREAALQSMLLVRNQKDKQRQADQRDVTTRRGQDITRENFENLRQYRESLTENQRENIRSQDQFRRARAILSRMEQEREQGQLDPNSEISREFTRVTRAMLEGLRARSGRHAALVEPLIRQLDEGVSAEGAREILERFNSLNSRIRGSGGGGGGGGSRGQSADAMRDVLRGEVERQLQGGHIGQDAADDRMREINSMRGDELERRTRAYEGSVRTEAARAERPQSGTGNISANWVVNPHSRVEIGPPRRRELQNAEDGVRNIVARAGDALAALNRIEGRINDQEPGGFMATLRAGGATLEDAFTGSNEDVVAITEAIESMIPAIGRTQSAGVLQQYELARIRGIIGEFGISPVARNRLRNKLGWIIRQSQGDLDREMRDSGFIPPGELQSAQGASRQPPAPAPAPAPAERTGPRTPQEHDAAVDRAMGR